MRSGPAAGVPARPYDKVMICISEDWFALSHFQPLIRTAAGLAREVVVVTNSSGRSAAIEALGARVIAFDYHRASVNPLREAATVLRLRRVFARERPDLVHLIALKPIVLGGAAIGFDRRQRCVAHVTGLGTLSISQTWPARLVRASVYAAIGRVLARPATHLLVENPDDLALLRARGIALAGRWTLIGGAGIDPLAMPALDPPAGPVPRVAFVGRMIGSKGVDTAIAAAEMLAAAHVPIVLNLYGAADPANPDALREFSVADQAANTMRAARWHGHVADVAAIWRDNAIFVLPSRGGEGLPRAMLEAAACARPLVVTDVPGCRHFVRDGIEGFVVPPDDPRALAEALDRLAGDPALRRSMGAAARRRLLEGYTEAAVMAGVTTTYEALSARGA